jgi:hypothetical protein
LLSWAIFLVNLLRELLVVHVRQAFKEQAHDT